MSIVWEELSSSAQAASTANADTTSAPAVRYLHGRRIGMRRMAELLVEK